MRDMALLLETYKECCFGYAQDQSQHTERRMEDAKKALLEFVAKLSEKIALADKIDTSPMPFRVNESSLHAAARKVVANSDEMGKLLGKALGATEDKPVRIDVPFDFGSSMGDSLLAMTELRNAVTALDSAQSTELEAVPPSWRTIVVRASRLHELYHEPISSAAQIAGAVKELSGAALKALTVNVEERASKDYTDGPSFMLGWDACENVVRAKFKTKMSPQGERDNFELWSTKFGRIQLDRRGDGYQYGYTNESWLAWQARASLEGNPHPNPDAIHWDTQVIKPGHISAIVELAKLACANFGDRLYQGDAWRDFELVLKSLVDEKKERGI